MVQLNPRDISRAIFKGDTESLEKYLELGMDITTVTENEKWTYLHIATQSVSLPIKIESIQFLISNKVSLNKQDVYGNTSLHYAARNKDEKAIETLLVAGAKFEIKNTEGITPLHQTLLQKPYNILATETLLAAGANIGELTEYVNFISHGDDSNIKDLFDKYQKKTYRDTQLNEDKNS